jgi:hypothetical protein
MPRIELIPQLTGDGHVILRVGAPSPADRLRELLRRARERLRPQA